MMGDIGQAGIPTEGVDQKHRAATGHQKHAFHALIGDKVSDIIGEAARLNAKVGWHVIHDIKSDRAC